MRVTIFGTLGIFPLTFGQTIERHARKRQQNINVGLLRDLLWYANPNCSLLTGREGEASQKEIKGGGIDTTLNPVAGITEHKMPLNRRVPISVFHFFFKNFEFLESFKLS